MVKVGDTIPPDVVVHIGFAGNTPTAPQTMGSLLKNRKVLLVTLPGAFTPT
jgi:peroxiredoxin